MDYSDHTDRDATKVEKFLGQYRTHAIYHVLTYYEKGLPTI